jgi:hypothetical protein
MDKSDNTLAAAIKTLESLQRSYAQPGEDLDARRKRKEQFAEDFAKKLGLGDDFLSLADSRQRDANSGMFSRYENPEWFSVVSRIVKEIETVISKMGVLRGKKKIIFGTSATGEINGLAADVDNPEYYIVLIEDGVFGYSNLLAKGIAHMLPLVEGESGGVRYSTDIAKVEENIKENPALVMRLVDLVLAYVIFGHPHAAEPYLPTKQYLPLTSIWREVMETFVLAHEFGHARLGHLDDLSQETVVVGESGALLPSWERELEADHFALLVALSVLAARGYAPSLTYAGIEAFFLGLELIERALSLFCGADYNGKGDVSHPPAAMRLAALRIGLDNRLPAEESKSAIALATILGRILEIVAPEIAKSVGKAKQNGLAPHPKWNNWLANIRESRSTMSSEGRASS